MNTREHPNFARYSLSTLFPLPLPLFFKTAGDYRHGKIEADPARSSKQFAALNESDPAPILSPKCNTASDPAVEGYFIYQDAYYVDPLNLQSNRFIHTRQLRLSVHLPPLVHNRNIHTEQQAIILTPYLNARYPTHERRYDQGIAQTSPCDG